MFSFFNIFKKIISYLPIEKKKNIPFIIFLLTINSVLEVFGVAGVLPLLVSLTHNDPINDLWWAKAIANGLNISSKEELLLILVWGLFSYFFLKSIISILIIKYINNFSFKIYRYLALKIASHTHDDYSFLINTKNSNEMVHDINRLSFYYANNQLTSSLYIITELITFIMILMGLILYQPVLFFLILLLILPFVFIPYMKIRKLSVVLGQKRKFNEPKLEQSYREHIFGYIDITLTNTRSYFLNKIRSVLNELVKINVNSTIINFIPPKIMELGIIFSLSIITTYSFMYDMPAKDLINILGFFVLAGFRMAPSINRINTSLNAMNTTSWVLTSLNDFDFKDQMRQISKNLNFEFQNKISLKEITFSYSDSKNLIFDNFSLEILKGQSVGIVGESGSGKTTLMNILLGFLPLENGELHLDKNLIKKDNLKFYWSKIGYIKQETFLINDTILKNVAFGLKDNDIDMGRFNHVISLAELSKFVESLELKENFIIKEGGLNISGGQRQRIGIARALYFHKEILFFDEATSALDEENQEKITLAIKKLSQNNITTVIISHRPSAVKYCDKIIDLN